MSEEFVINVELFGENESFVIKPNEKIYDEVCKKFEVMPDMVECYYLNELLDRNIVLCESELINGSEIRVVPHRKFSLYALAPQNIGLSSTDDIASSVELYGLLLGKRFKKNEYIILLELMNILKDCYNMRNKEEKIEADEEIESNQEEEEEESESEEEGENEEEFEIDVMTNLLVNFVKINIDEAIPIMFRYINPDFEKILDISIKENCHRAFVAILESYPEVNFENVMIQVVKTDYRSEFIKTLVTKGAKNIQEAYDLALEKKNYHNCFDLMQDKINEIFCLLDDDYIYSLFYKLIEAGADINYGTSYEKTPLISAISKGQDRLAKCLIDYGARTFNDEDPDKNAVYYAVKHDSRWILDKLLDMKVSVSKSALLIAIELGHKSILDRILSTDFSCDTRGINVASLMNNLNVFQMGKLIKNGADIESRHNGRNLMFIALKSPSYRKAEDLLSLNIEVYDKDENGITTLMLAAISHPNLIKGMVEKGLDINETDNNGDTALVCAARKNESSLSVLLDLGADPNIYANLSPLCIASERGKLEPVEKLIQKGAKINLKEGIDSPLLIAIKNDNYYIIKELLRNGADPEIKGKNKVHCLLQILYTDVCQHNRLEVVSGLIEAGVNINVKNQRDNSAVQIAIMTQKNDCALLLLEKGAILDNIDKQDENGNTLLMHAINNIKIVDKLLEAGADPNILNKKGESAVYLSIKKGCEKIYEKLISAGAEVDVNDHKLIHTSIFSKFHNVTKDLIKRGADINGKYNGKTPLICCIERFILAENVLQYDPDVDIFDSDGKNALIYAFENRRSKEVILSLINKSNKPFIGNIKISSPEILEKLILKKSLPVDTEIDGETALLRSMRIGDFATAKTLIEMGANVNVKDRRNISVVQYAFINGNKKMFEELRNRNL